MPLCILLLGAGGTRDSLFDLQELFDTCWAEGSVPPMIIVTPTPGFDYYLEDPAGPIRWDSFLATDLVPHLRSAYNPRELRACGSETERRLLAKTVHLNGKHFGVREEVIPSAIR